jgi:phosphatidylglycerol:prolipoprotein diacylglycerol transferase
MLPILLTLGPITIHTLGFLLAIGYFLGSFIGWRRLKELGIKEEKIIDCLLLVTFGGLFLARVFYLGLNWEKFGFSPLRWLFFSRYPGFSPGGGILGMVLVLARFTKKEKLNFWAVADEIAFGLLPFLVLLQLGNFFDGNTPGKPTSLPWGIFFPGTLWRQQPVSLFFAAGLSLIWIFIIKIERHWRTWDWYQSQANGFIFLAFMSLLMLLNFLLAFWKTSKLYFQSLEIILSLLGVVLGAGLILFRSRKKHGQAKTSG